MFITLVICAVMAFFAMGLIVGGSGRAAKQDIALSWFIMFVSSCIVVFPFRWLFLWIF